MDSAVDAVSTQLVPPGANPASSSYLEGSVTETNGGCDCKYCLGELRRVRDEDGDGIENPRQRQVESMEEFKARHGEIISETAVNQWNEKIKADLDKQYENGGASPRAKDIIRRVTRHDPRSLMEMEKAAAAQLQPEIKHEAEHTGDKTRMVVVDQAMAQNLVEECSVHQPNTERHPDDNGGDGNSMSSGSELEDDQAGHGGVDEAGGEVNGNSFNAQLKNLHDNSNAAHTVSGGYSGAQLSPPWYPEQRISGISSLAFPASQDSAVSEDSASRRPPSWDMPPPGLPKDRNGSMTNYVVHSEISNFERGEKRLREYLERKAEEQARRGREREREAAMAVEETIERNGELSSEGLEDEGREIVLGPQGKWCDGKKMAGNGVEKDGAPVDGGQESVGQLLRPMQERESLRGAVALHEDGDWELL